jgi:DNA-binding CsgD family transcriptional regulator
MKVPDYIVRHDGSHGSRELTQKEIDIMRLICDDCSTKEIAGLIKRSLKTVDHHRANIYKKTGTNSLVGLFRWAILNGHVVVTNEQRTTTPQATGGGSGHHAAARSQTAKGTQTQKGPAAEATEAAKGPESKAAKTSKTSPYPKANTSALLSGGGLGK